MKESRSRIWRGVAIESNDPTPTSRDHSTSFQFEPEQTSRWMTLLQAPRCELPVFRVVLVSSWPSFRRRAFAGSLCLEGSSCRVSFRRAAALWAPGPDETSLSNATISLNVFTCPGLPESFVAQAGFLPMPRVGPSFGTSNLARRPNLRPWTSPAARVKWRAFRFPVRRTFYY